MASKIWTYIKPILDAIIFSNIWIALAALSLFSSVLIASGNTEEFYAALTVFTATFIAYNFLKLKGIEHVANNSVFFDWLKKHKSTVSLMLLLAFFMLLIALFHLSYLQLLVCGISILIALIYVGSKKYNLRHFWFLKTPIVAFVWAFFIVALALINYYETLNYLRASYLFIACFLFIEGLTIPFEIRDLKADSKVENLKTLPMLFGLKMTKLIAVFHLLFALLFFTLYNTKLLILAHLFIIAIAVIYKLNMKSSEYYYTFILDGLIILSFPLLCLVY